MVLLNVLYIKEFWNKIYF